jgi:uncharacterized protein
MFEVVDSGLLRSWVRTGVAALGESRAEIDALNVFPVPDGDTGTNMFLTLEAAEQAMIEADHALSPIGDSVADEADAMRTLSTALVRGALLGARGNSGVILSQILRGMVMVDPVVDQSLRAAGDVIKTGLAKASDLAYAAVGDPKEGTILTVVRRAAEEAATVTSEDLAEVVRVASQAAEEALERTTEQLPALTRAGVVDSGGRGFVVILAALLEVVTGERRPPPPVGKRLPVPVHSGPDDDYTGPGFEVMYLLETADASVTGLKGELAALGDSLVVVGGDGLWNVHVHVDDVGAAIEAALSAGRPHRIRVTYLMEGAEPREHGMQGRAVVAVAHGPGMEALLDDVGVGAIPAQPRLAPSTGEILDAIVAQAAGEVVVLPSDKETRASAEAAAVSARAQGLRVAVVPSRSIAQSLAAIAVHDPGLAFDDDVVSMSRASGATRYGAVTVSSREAMTTAGLCHPGDILGVVDGDILQIGRDMAAVAAATLDRMLSSGGELVTVITGADAPPRLVEGVRDHLAQQYPGVEVTVYDGGQPLWPLIFGVE